MDTITRTVTLERETKGTFVYGEPPNEAGTPPVLKSIYLPKWAIGTTAPPTLTITVENGEKVKGKK